MWFKNIYPVTKRNDLVRMEIEDQGIGIPQNEYHKIFNDFTEEVPRRSWKRVVQESDFFYREKLSKTRRYDYGNLRQKKKEARL